MACYLLRSLDFISVFQHVLKKSLSQFAMVLAEENNLGLMRKVCAHTSDCVVD